MFVFNVYLDSRLLHFNIPLHDTVVLGSDQTSTLRLRHPGVSPCHASLEPRENGGRTEIVIKGTSETFVNDEPVRERSVGPGDDIRIGSYRIEILKAHKNILPTFQEDESQKVVFQGDPFSRETSLAARLQAIHELCLSVSNVPVPILLECAAATLKRGLIFEHFAIMLSGSHGFLTCTTWDRHGPCKKSDVQVSRSLVDHCVETGQAIISENLELDRRFAGSDSVKAKAVSSAMCVPLRGGGRMLGLIYCTTDDRKHPFTHEDLQFATVVATQVATALRHGRDLSQVKATATKLNALLDHVREGVIVCDRDFMILATNRSALELLGKDGLDGDRLEAALSGLDHTFEPASAMVRTTFEVTLRGSGDGLGARGVRSLRGYVHRIDIPHQEDWHYLICLFDETERRRADQIKVAFVRQLAHKLRTPLTVFIGVMSLLEQHLDGRVDHEVRWLLENGESSCAEMRDLIDQFVSFSSVGLGDGANRDLPFHDVAALVEQGLSLASLQAEVRGLTILQQVPRERFELSADAARIAYCISQVVHNAGKFAPGSKLTIRATLDEDGLWLYFVDDGPGIPPADLPRIVELFEQVDHGSTGQIPGCGLGLWWTREILRAHGGNLEVRSPDPVTGAGTRVEFAFPAARVRETAEDANRGGAEDAEDAQRRERQRDRERQGW